MAISKISTKGMSGDTLEAGDIAPNAIGASELADNAVDTAAIAATSITEAKLNADVTDGSAIQTPTKPHIQPGTLYPAWRGLIDGHTGFTFTDSSATPKTITPAGSKVSHTAGQKKFGSTSIYFDGVVGDYLEITDHADFTFGTGNFTIEFFVNMGDQAGNYTTLFHSANHDVRVTIGASATAPTLSFYSDTWDAHTSGTTDIGDNAWHHCAIVREGTDLKIYVDGALEATRASSGNSLDPDNIRIGQYATSLPFKGYIDEIRITKGLAVYTGAFTVPTTALSTTWAANPFGGSNTAANSTASNVSFLLHSDNGGNSGAYGTAQTDGKKYYYTDIKGSKPIKDPRIGAHFGSQRHKIRSIQLLEQETATQSSDVFSIDGREWMRCTGGNWQMLNNGHGHRLMVGNASTYPDAYIEVVGYFNGINTSAYTDSNHKFRYSLDGGSEVATDYGANSSGMVLSQVGTRFVDAGSSTNIPISTTLGIHTIKLRSTGAEHDVYGIELIAQDTGSTVRRNHVNIPAQNVVSYGKKFSIGSDTLTNAVHKHHNPFAFKTDGTTAWNSGAHNGTSFPIGTGSSTNIDTATSLGLENWKHSNNYYKPYNGGRVVKWIASDGTIKTSVTVMPPNAQNIAGSAISAKANASVANNTYLPTFEAGATDHSLSEIAKTFNIREFGNGNANGGAGGTWKDLSMQDATHDNIGFVMDDGLTAVAGEDIITGIIQTENYASVGNSNGDKLYITFIGTGISYTGGHAGKPGPFEPCQNLSYGTHVLIIERDTSAGDGGNLVIDNVNIFDDATTALGNYGIRYPKDVSFYQPKMPPIPEDAVVISDYMLMADFVADTAGVPASISKGVRRNGNSRDMFYNETDDGAITFTTAEAVPPAFTAYLADGSASSATAFKVRLPSFGTNFVHRGHNTTGKSDQYVDDTIQTSTDTSGAGNTSGSHLTTDKDLGVYNWGHNAKNGQPGNVEAYDIVTPIHSSSHYQTFEGPFSDELVGGDRNMEQNNLIVTPDGKSWDEVTRDTSYIGNVVLSARFTGGDKNGAYVAWDDWRGRLNQQDLFNKKEWAIAYDQVICMVTGYYHISMFGCGANDNQSIQIKFRLNKNTSNVMMVHAEAHDDGMRVTGNVEHSGYFIRGDALSFYVANFEGYDPYLNSFQIQKLS